MNAKYIIRLDDACPTMDRNKWNTIEKILDKNDIKPVVAVIPNNEDMSFNNEVDIYFWEKVKNWQNKGWDIALHGYNHVYTTLNGGLVYNRRIKDSEFAGVSIEKQEEKIRKGIEIFERYGIKTKIWIAPSHTFDKNTLLALNKYTTIDIVSDGIALSPFIKNGFKWIPQQLWNFKNHIIGTWTICLHPNSMNDEMFEEMKHFIVSNKNRIIRLSNIHDFNKKMTLGDRLYNFLFWKKYDLIKTLFLLKNQSFNTNR